MNANIAMGYARLGTRHLRRFTKAAWYFPLEREARAKAAQFLDGKEFEFKIDERSGWGRFDVRMFPDMASELSKLQELANRWVGEAENRSSGGFPLDLLLPSDLETHPDILRFALHDQFLMPATAYLGQVPRLTALKMLWSPKNETLKGSQKFHYDHRDNRQVKMFVNLVDVTEKQGPLFFFPADESTRFNAKVGYTQKKIEDDAVFQACNKERLVGGIGDAGTGVMVDTARCLHYGSRRNLEDRLILMINFVRPTCVKTTESRALDPLRGRFADELYSDDPVRRFALTAQAR